MRFGMECGALKAKNITMDKAVNLDDQTIKLKRHYQACLDEIQDMESRGMGGVLDMGTPKPTRDGFIRNFKSLRSHEKALNDMKQANSKNITQMEFHLAQINKDRGILLRQLTTDIWKEPNPKYVVKCQEKMDLEGRLYRIT